MNFVIFIGGIHIRVKHFVTSSMILQIKLYHSNAIPPISVTNSTLLYNIGYIIHCIAYISSLSLSFQTFKGSSSSLDFKKILNVMKS